MAIRPNNANQDVIFHVGLHKTGTTHLQNNVFTRMARGTYIKRQSRFPEVIRELAMSCRPVLVSDEGLSGHLSSPNYEIQRSGILTSLAQTWPGSKLILVVREPSTMVVSLYHDYLCQGGTQGLDVWLERTRILDSMRFDKLIEEVDRLPFSKKLFLDYDLMRTRPDQVIAAIEKLVGCRFPGCKLTPDSKSNVSVNRHGARFLRCMNHFVPHPRSAKGRLSALLAKVLLVSKTHPRALIQHGMLRFLNRVGRPTISDDRLLDIRQSCSESWARAKMLIENRSDKG